MELIRLSSIMYSHPDRRVEGKAINIDQKTPIRVGEISLRDKVARIIGDTELFLWLRQASLAHSHEGWQ